MGSVGRIAAVGWKYAAGSKRGIRRGRAVVASFTFMLARSSSGVLDLGFGKFIMDLATNFRAPRL